MSDGQIVIDTRLNTDGVASGVNRIQSEAQKAGKAFDNAGEVAEREWGQSMRETTEETTQSVSTIKSKVENLSDGFSKLAKAIGLAFVVDKIKDVSKAVVETGINYNALKEQSLAAWSTILGSDKAAKSMFDRIVSFAATTPFTQMGVDQMAKQLTNAGFQGQALFDQLTKFGDMGSAFAIQEDSLKEMVRQYGQVQQAGVAYTEDLNILQDRGIPIFKALAEVMGVHTSQVKQLASQGKITADVYNKAINKIADSTKGAMEKQSLTFNGLMSTLKDNMSILAGTLAKPVFEKLKGQLESFLPAFQNFVDLVGKKGLAQALSETFPQLKPLINLINVLGSILTTIVIPAIKTVSSFVLEHIGLFATLGTTLVIASLGFKTLFAISDAIKFIGTVQKAISTIKGFEIASKLAAAGQWLLNIAMSANPIALIIIAISALVVGFIYLWNTSEGFRNFWIGLWNGIKEITKKVIDTLGKYFTNLIKWFKDIPQNIGIMVKAIETWFKNIPIVINKYFDLALKTLKQWGTNVWNFFTQTIPKWISSIGQWFMQLPQKIGFALGFAAGKIYLWGQSVWNFFTVTIPQWINFIGQWFAKLPGEIWKWLVNTYNKVIAWGNNMIQKAIAIGTEFINNIINWFSQLPSRIWTWLVDTYNKVATWGSNLVQKAIETASNFINNFINWISQLPEKFMSWLSQTINNVIAWGRNLANAGLNAGRELVNSIVNTVKAIPGHMLSIGTDIVRGIWTGIINAKDWIVGKISGFAGSIVGGFKSALGIHSPARKLYSTGKYTIQGVQVGMENEMPNLNDQIDNQMTGMVGRMKATVKAQTSAQNFKASFGAMHMNMNKSFKLIGDNEKQPIVINLDEKHLLDGEVIAAHTTHKVIENISENQNNYAIATGGI